LVHQIQALHWVRFLALLLRATTSNSFKKHSF
jgi:hypothetical protein